MGRRNVNCQASRVCSVLISVLKSQRWNPKCRLAWTREPIRCCPLGIRTVDWLQTLYVVLDMDAHAGKSPRGLFISELISWPTQFLPLCFKRRDINFQAFGMIYCLKMSVKVETFPEYCQFNANNKLIANIGSIIYSFFQIQNSMCRIKTWIGLLFDIFYLYHVTEN